MSIEIIFFLLAGLALLVLGGEALVKGATALASKLGIPPMIIGLTVVAFGTSTPELAVSLSAALRGNADIAISNVVGSNIFNVFFILGLCACIRALEVQSQIIFREVPLMIGLSVLFFLLALDNEISRLEGGMLFLGIVAYTSWLVVESLKHKNQNKELEAEAEEAFHKEPSQVSLVSSILRIAIGLGIVMLGARWMVDGAVGVARFFEIPEAVIGLTIVAAGTSLPEVIASVIATIKGEREIAIGNVIGSNIYNILAIVGLSGTIVPGGLNVSESILRLDMPVMIAAAALCLPFFWTGRRLSRTEGVIFLLIYCAYTTYLICLA
jgi:cation:H+ antiporter